MSTSRADTYRGLARLARRRWWLAVGISLALLAGVVTVSATDRRRCWLAGATRPDDVWRYQGARVANVHAAGANSLLLPDGTRLALLATRPPRDGDFARLAQRRLEKTVAGREVLLRLEPQSTRDSSGTLRAHVYINDRNIAIELLKQGTLRVDRESQSPFRDTFLAAEDAARRKHLGLWLQTAPDTPRPRRGQGL
ncbi:MAG: thermonuclease family protein [Tepidisphaerales bacterium]